MRKNFIKKRKKEWIKKEWNRLNYNNLNTKKEFGIGKYQNKKLNQIFGISEKSWIKVDNQTTSESPNIPKIKKQLILNFWNTRKNLNKIYEYNPFPFNLPNLPGLYAPISNKLQAYQKSQITSFIQIKSEKGFNHYFNYPVRGQKSRK